MAHAGKVAIVTGSAGGIGRGIAEYLVKEGVKVVIADMNEKLGRETAAELNARYAHFSVSCFLLSRLTELFGADVCCAARTGKRSPSSASLTPRLGSRTFVLLLWMPSTASC